MAYWIKDINNCNPDSYAYYFFDANAWIAALKNTRTGACDPHEQLYIDFFEAVVQLHSHKGTKQEKMVKNFPKFIFTSMLMSEIINAYMRKVAMKVFYASKGYDFKNFDYKKDYRKENDHNKQLLNLTSDIAAFKDYIEVYDDNFSGIDPYKILSNVTSSTDFNDYYYYLRFKNSGIPVVTHDQDFKFQDLEIITAQSKLLKLV